MTNVHYIPYVLENGVWREIRVMSLMPLSKQSAERILEVYKQKGFKTKTEKFKSK